MTQNRPIRADSGEVPEYQLFETIGEGDATLKGVSQFLKANSHAPKVVIRASSGGGEIYTGIAIYEALRRFSGTVITVGSGVVASAAAIIFLAGSVRKISSNCSLMVHNSWALEVTGGAGDMRKVATSLELIDNQMLAIVKKATGKPDSVVREWLAAETWFTPEEAVRDGLATELVGNAQASLRTDISRFKNLPASAKAGRKTSLTEMFAEMNAKHQRSPSLIPYAGSPKQPAKAVSRSAGGPKSLLEIIQLTNRR